MNALLDAARSALDGAPDILVLNHGGPPLRKAIEVTGDELAGHANMMMFSLIRMVQLVVPGMRERGFGRVVVISSINGQKGQFGQVNYAATKAGDLGIVKSLAQEGAAKGITANAICPGYIATDMVMAVPEKVREAIIGQIPTGRLGEPEEIARCVVFLASDQSRYITGKVIPVDGGIIFG